MNKEDGLRRSLSRLFNLYLASEKYQQGRRHAGTDPGRRPLRRGPQRSVGESGRPHRLDLVPEYPLAHATSFFRAPVSRQDRGRRRRRKKPNPWKTSWSKGRCTTNINFPPNWQRRWKKSTAFSPGRTRRTKGFATSTKRRDTRPSSKRLPPPWPPPPGQTLLPRAPRHSNLLTTCGKFPKLPPTFIVNRLRKECSRSPSMRLAVR